MIRRRDGTAGVDDAFLEVPRLVYADDPHWIPEDPAAVRRAFSAANAWFSRGRACTLVAPERARLALFHDPCLRVDGRATACFGYWEHRDPAAALELLAEAEGWARLAGAERLLGPIDFTTFGAYRLRLDADRAEPPFPGEPYNPPQYADLLTDAGYDVAQRYVTQVGAPPPGLCDALAPLLAGLRADGYALERLDGDGWLALLPEVHGVADEIFGAGFAYAPVSYAAFAASHGAPVARRLCPRTSAVVRDADGRLAAFLLVCPHYGPLVAQGAVPGRVPPAELSFAAHAPLLARLGHRAAVVRTVGVRPAHRRRRLMEALVLNAFTQGAGHYDRWLGALIRDDNPSRRLGLANGIAERRYALFAKPLGREHA